MTKKILQLVVVLLISAQAVMAQTVQIVSLSNASPGSIQVEVDMDNYTDVSAITLYIGYNSALLNFTGITNTTLTGTWVANYNASIDKVIVTYTAAPGYTNNPTGKLFDLQFYNNGGFSSDITFDEPNCEIVEYLTTIPTTYTNGTVTQSASDGTVSMTNANAQVGSAVNMPVTLVGTTGYNAVDAITIKIEYDNTQLTYTGLVNTLASLSGVVANASAGVLTIDWVGTAIDFTTIATLYDVQFRYNGGNANVNFVPGSEIANSGTVLATDYHSAIISPASAAASLTIGHDGAIPDSLVPTVVNIPVTANGLASTTLGAITLNFNYDNSDMVYTGYTADQLSGWVVSGNSSGEISMNWSNATGALISDGSLVTLIFNTDTIHGKDAITFSPGTILIDHNLDPVSVGLFDGYIVNYTASFTFVDDSGNDVGGVSITLDGTTLNPAGADTLFYGLDDGTYAYSVTKTGYGDVTGSFTIAGGNITENVVLYPDLFADVKVYLQGAYTTSAMSTTLNSVLPLTQPYSGLPWNYAGTESVTAVPANAVDWVLLELRTGIGASSTIATRAAFVLSDGSIVDTDGTSQVKFSNISADNYYVVVKHRFHLAIMSATAQALSGTSSLYDFTSAMSQTYNPTTGVNPLKDLGDGNWGLYSGDGNADGNITAPDVTVVYLSQAPASGYFTGDWNMDGNVSAPDVTVIYLGNANKSTQVPN